MTKNLRKRLWALVPEPDFEHRVLELLTEAVGADKALWASAFRSGRPGGILASPHLSERERRLHNEVYGPRNPMVRRAGEAIVAGRVVRDVDLVDLRELEQTEFFHDWMRPYGGRSMIALVEDGDDEIRTACLLHDVRRGDFGDHQRALLQALLPDLVRAYWVQARTAAGPGQGEHYLDSIDGSYGVLALDQRGRVREINERAEALIEAAPELRIQHGQLRTGVQIHDRQIDTALSGATLRRTTFTVHAEERSVRVELVPMADVEAPVSAHNTRVVVLLQELPARPRPPGADALPRLSGAERRLLEDLVRGRTLRQIADERHRSIHTVRSQLKSLFRKTDTSSQIELVRRFARYFTES